MKENSFKMMVIPSLVALFLGTTLAFGDEVPQRKNAQGIVKNEDLIQKEKKEIAAVIAKGDALWHDRTIGTNGMACNMCHPDAAVTHPETFPKFKSQMGSVVTAQQFINWCVIVPLQGKGFTLGSPELVALEAYMVSQNQGQSIEIGLPSP